MSTRMGAKIGGTNPRPGRKAWASGLPPRRAARRKAANPILDAGARDSWKHERTVELVRVCRYLQGERDRGRSLSQAVLEVARHYRGRHYDSDPSRRLPLSVATLFRIFRCWQAAGPDALRLRYVAYAKIRQPGIRRLVRAACLPGVVTLSAVFRKTARLGASAAAYRKALDRGGYGAALRRVFALRRETARAVVGLKLKLKKGTQP